jgi:hypothetical protein
VIRAKNNKQQQANHNITSGASRYLFLPIMMFLELCEKVGVLVQHPGKLFIRLVDDVAARLPGRISGEAT